MQNNEINFAETFVVVLAIIGFLLLLGMLFFVVMLFGYSAKRRNYDKERGDEMQLASEKIGFDFTPQATLSELPFLPSFTFFEGRSESIENLMIGELKEHKSAIFDLLYQVFPTTEEQPVINRQTVLVIESESLNLPHFYLRPATSAEKIPQGLKKFEYSKSSKFQEKYVLYGADETAVLGLFSYSVVEFCENNPAFSAFGKGSHLFLYVPQKTLQSNEIQQWMKILGFLYNLLKN